MWQPNDTDLEVICVRLTVKVSWRMTTLEKSTWSMKVPTEGLRGHKGQKASSFHHRTFRECLGCNTKYLNVSWNDLGFLQNAPLTLGQTHCFLSVWICYSQASLLDEFQAVAEKQMVLEEWQLRLSLLWFQPPRVFYKHWSRKKSSVRVKIDWIWAWLPLSS